MYIIYSMCCLPAQGFNVVSSIGQMVEITTGASLEGTSVFYYVVALLLIAVTAYIAFGGIRKVTKVTDKVVPVMAVVYVAVVFVLILLNLHSVPYFLGAVFGGAFTPQAIFGGVFGTVLVQGVKRGLMSNEAGQGTITMAAGAANTNHPCEQGCVQSIGVFLDTMVICTITALSVILSGNWTDGTNGGTLALSAFASGFGKFGSILLAVIMVIFTVTTSGGWFTYYLAILEHLYKKEGKMKDIVMKIFYAVRALPGVLWTIYLVKTNNQGFIWTVVDITSAIPTFVNVAVILILSNQYFKLLKDYKARNFGQGTVDKNACLFYEEKTK